MSRNTCHPIFLNTANLHFLFIGGGYLAQEQVTCLLHSSHELKVTIVSPYFREGLKTLSSDFNMELVTDVYRSKYLKGKHIVVATTDNPEVNLQVYNDCRAVDKLVSVPYEPSYCDFSSARVATKGDVKIAISTKGKDPAISQRLCNFFEDIIPEDIH